MQGGALVKFVTEWVHDDVPVQWPSTQEPGESEAHCRDRNLREAHARMAYQGFEPDVGTEIRTFRDTGLVSDQGVLTAVDGAWTAAWIEHVGEVVKHYP